MTGAEQQTIAWVEDMATNGVLFAEDLRWARDNLSGSPVPRDPIVEAKIGDWTYLLDIGTFPSRGGGVITGPDGSGGVTVASMVEGASPALLVGVGLVLFMLFRGKRR